MFIGESNALIFFAGWIFVNRGISILRREIGRQGRKSGVLSPGGVYGMYEFESNSDLRHLIDQKPVHAKSAYWPLKILRFESELRGKV